MEIGLGQGYIVLDGDLAPAQKKGRGTSSPIFGPYLLWQMAGWIKIPLGTEVGLSPSHVVLDGDPAPPKKGHSPPPPLFGPCLL